MSTAELVPLPDLAEIHDYLREPVNLTERNKRVGEYPYYGATGQVGWIDEFRQEGDYVLLGEDGAPFLDPHKPKAYLVSGKCWVNNHAHVLRGKDGICDNEYLCYALNWADYSDAVTGSTRLKLPQSTMPLVLIPAYTIEEQRRIAAHLKNQLSIIEEVRNAVVVQTKDVQKLFPAILQKAFDNVADTETVKLKDVANIQLGKMLSPKSKTGVSSFPYLRNQNVQWGRIDLTDVAQMDFSEIEKKKFSLSDGDLLVCEGGEPGRCAIWRGERQDYFYQKALHRIRPQSDDLVPEYLMYWLWYQAQTGAFEDQNAKTTIAHLPVVRLEQLSLPLPGPDTQRRIAKNLSGRLAEVRAVQATISEQLKNIETLPSRLLAQVFGDN